ncbi:hypothetical protein [Brevundimonas sp.]|uniref:hypothetical protein n=1 Tax=Brevundimonas sp. TaxID=1871086 RepID=UPI00261A4E57|nr:hypothetical protein [Brevundimonas sp.]
MKSFTRSRSFKRVLTVIYWIALPLVLLAMVGSVLPGNQYEGPLPSWVYALGFAAFAALIGWRLWLNSRALGYATPSAGRVLRVIAPLGLLAIAGLVVALLGAAWIGIGLWLTFDPEAGPAGPWPLGTAIVGFLSLIFGLALTLPFIRVVRRAPPEEADIVEPKS